MPRISLDRLSCLLVVACLTLVLAPTFAVSAPLRVAVLEVQYGGLGPQQLSAISDAVREGALAALPPATHRVLSREGLQSFAEDNQIDLSCLDTEEQCEVGIGRALGVSFILTTSLSELSGSWLATVKIHEMKEGGLLASRTSTAPDPLALLGALRAATEALLRDALDLARPQEGLQDGEAVLEGRRQRPSLDDDGRRIVIRFESSPPGAVVMLDGILLCQATPCSQEVEVGEHQVEMQLPRHHPAIERMTLRTQRKVGFDLRPTFGSLAIGTDPAGLLVSVGGGPSQPTPLLLEGLAAGAYDVRLAAPCYVDDGQRVVVEEGGDRTLRLVARPRLAALAVRAVADDGNAVGPRVVVDGVAVGEAPGTFEVPACASELELRAGGHLLWRDRLSLHEGETLAVDATMQVAEVPGTVHVLAADEQGGSLDASVWADGRPLGRVGQDLPLRAGRHRIAVRHGGYESARGWIDVQRGQSTWRVDARLLPGGLPPQTAGALGLGVGLLGLGGGLTALTAGLDRRAQDIRASLLGGAHPAADAEALVLDGEQTNRAALGTGLAAASTLATSLVTFIVANGVLARERKERARRLPHGASVEFRARAEGASP